MRKKTNAVNQCESDLRGKPRREAEASLLVERVSAVDDAVGAGHEARSIRSKEDAQAVELVDVAEACLRGEALPDLLLGVEGGDFVEGGVHVARRDAVDADVVLGPLGRQRPAQLDHARLGRVVARLLLRVVDNTTAHGRDQHDGCALASRDGSPPDGLRHEERAREVDIHQAPEHGGVVRLGGEVAVCDSRRVDEHVGRAVRVADGLHRRVDGAAVADVYLIERHGEARLGVQLCRGRVAEVLVRVEKGDGLGAGLGAGSGHVVAQAAGAAVRGEMLGWADCQTELSNVCVGGSWFAGLGGCGMKVKWLYGGILTQ